MVAGLPTTTAFAGTFLVTTAPAPTIARLPMVRPGRMVALAPMDAPWRTTVLRNASGYSRLRGKRSLVKVALGPTKTSSSSSTPSQSWTPHFTVTRSPTTALPSTNTPSQMLQFSPIFAPGRMWAKAQTRVPTPI